MAFHHCLGSSGLLVVFRGIAVGVGVTVVGVDRWRGVRGVVLLKVVVVEVELV
jgi:hypothetical protein